ncbi:MAG: hypothetical protein A2157_10260 [Deltaproteobacteria bacterium RBG_16_47_11]|nr:MAG: hypothetical protein A2157_10260 [Deltaproteobacteria bacterium RBG_16_47_11]
MAHEISIGGLLNALKGVKGIKAASLLDDQHRSEILKIEQEAEEKALMGFGKTFNSGLREVLECEIVIAALTDMDFEWGCFCGMQLKKGNQVVGEEIRDPNRLRELSQRSDVYFLHKNFVIYKGRINFPQDIMNKVCQFEFPCACVDWFSHLDGIESCIFCNPSTPTDLYIKKNYFEDKDERGLGTILVGVTCPK